MIPELFFSRKKKRKKEKEKHETYLQAASPTWCCFSSVVRKGKPVYKPRKQQPAQTPRQPLPSALRCMVSRGPMNAYRRPRPSDMTRSSLVVQRLRLCLPLQAVWVPSLVGQLGIPWYLWAKTQNVKQKQYGNKFQEDLGEKKKVLAQHCKLAVLRLGGKKRKISS